MIEKIQCRSKFCRFRWIPRVEAPIKCPRCGYPWRAPKVAKTNPSANGRVPATATDTVLNVEVSKFLP